MGGAYEHAAEHGSQSPYNLPDSWMKLKAKLDLKTPLQFCFDGGHHRRQLRIPTVNKNGEVVGIIFDGNIESLPWNFAYSDTAGACGFRGFSRHSGSSAQDLRRDYARG